ncbi:MAG TPA: class II aldolase/adducin family protein [Candidatus Dormibacteraeota bacterium]|nr:class II aldolase/adducin family protein [Candidatus Dormibacteraeota bacterium]
MDQAAKAAGKELVETAQAVLRSGAISMSGHGNISIRVPGRDELIFTGGSSLRQIDENQLVRLSLDGRLLEGELPPIAAAVVHMHTAIYQDRSDTRCVIHTHSPYATAFAVANRPLEGWSEAFGIFGLKDGVPVAAYGPRGSEQAIANIRAVMTPKTTAVLLANHGVLAWAPDSQRAVQLGVIIEETAQSAILAGPIGGAKIVPADMLHASIERHAHFESAGALKTG